MVIVMDLKTLKQIEFESDTYDLGVVSRSNELRKEAIKWCKEIKREANEIIMSPAKYIEQGKKLNYLTGQIMILEHFFNLTDDEI
jgi:hypothetical protein